MDVTNNLALSVLKGYRDIEENGMSVSDDATLSRLLAETWSVKETFSKYEKALKTELEKRKIDTTMYPDLEAKVYLAEGNDKTEYNTKVIGDVFNAAGRIDDFYKIVSIGTSLVSANLKKGDTLLKIIEDNKTVQASDKKIVKASKMTKDELAEAVVTK